MVWLEMEVPENTVSRREVRFVDLSEVKQVRAIKWYYPDRRESVLKIRFFNRYGKLVGTVDLPVEAYLVRDAIVQRVVRLVQEREPKLAKFEGAKLLVFSERKNEWVVDTDFLEGAEGKDGER